MDSTHSTRRSLRPKGLLQVAAAPLLALAATALLVLSGGCRPEAAMPTGAPSATEPAVALTAALTEAVSGVRTVTAGDGVPIVYEVRGEGEPTLVFVHCWSCNRGFWLDQIEGFAADHRVVAIDLPGHGESGRDRGSWSLSGLGDDVRTVVDDLGLDRVVLIGHSMGGPVALDAARRLGERVVAVVAVDTLHNAEFEWPEGMTEQMAQRIDTDREGFMAQFIPSMFQPDADPAVVAWVEREAMKADAEATAALMRDFETVDLPELLRQAGAPVRAINAAPGEQGMPTAIEINRRYADFDAVLIDGVGHFLQVEKPEEFNRRLTEVLEGLRTRGAG